MIVVKLSGGLGNQMFQYAAGKYLAHKHHTELLLDLSYLNKNPQGNYTKRHFELDVFNIKAGFASADDIKRFGIEQSSKISRELQRRFPQLFKYLYAAESGSAYQSQFSKYGENTYLDGFWQSDAYFSSIRELMLLDFSLKSPLSNEVTEMAQQIKNCHAVSLHVRRGDYVLSQQNHSTHGTLPLSYYQQAIKLINTRFPEKIFVFSDDLNWCKQNLVLETKAEIVFVEFKEQVPGSQELILMSYCKHNIIANSSFSWWGAWLNANKEKTVIAPEKWFQSGKNPDIYPQGWVRI